jgi:hypothetical protein
MDNCYAAMARRGPIPVQENNTLLCHWLNCPPIVAFLLSACIGSLILGALAVTEEERAGMHHDDRATNTAIAVPVNAWTTFQTDGFPAEIVGYDATVYANSIKRHIVLGKYHHYGSEPNYCMDGWSWDENRWDILDCGAAWHTEHMMEGGHTVGAFVYMTKRDSIVYWGGQSGSNEAEQAFHTWWWDVVSRVGRDKISTTRPGLARVSAMAYDQVRDKVVFYPDASFQAEVYDPATNTWTTPRTSGTPPPRGLTFPALEWNSSDHKTYLYGGAVGNNCATGLTFNDSVYTFDPGNNRWSKLSIMPDPIKGLPAGRKYAGFAYDPVDNIFLLVGGQNCASGKGSDAVGLSDTWKFDPTAMRWTRLNPATNYMLRSPFDAPFQKLRYDSDHHAFVMILPSYDNRSSIGGTWGDYSARVWVYCYSANCPNIGTAPRAYPAPSGSLNRNSGQPVTSTDQTWASDTAITASDHKLYAGWIETGLPFSSTNCSFHRPYVQAGYEGQWFLLGSDCIAMDSRASAVDRDAEKLSLTVVNGTLWASWSEANIWVPIVFAKYWSGERWVGGPIGTRNPGGLQGFSQLISADGIPTIAFIENNRAVFPDIAEAYVDQYNGNGWSALGGKLNKNPSGRVESLTIASDGAIPQACWTEEVISGWSLVKPAQLYCGHWDGSSWKELGSSLNNAAANWAADVSMACMGGHVYIAWTERTTAGNAQLYVKVWQGSGWSLLSEQPLNADPKNGWVFHPRLATNGSNPFISWEEQLSLDQPSRLFVARWNGTTWSRLGGALNVDQANGSVAHSSIAVLEHQPVVLWNEVNLGQLQQTYAKRWDGTSWTPLSPNSTDHARPGASSD